MQYHIVNAFSKNGKGGNPAAVVINQPLSASEKQEVARLIGFSETAFINQTNDQLHIEFFTPDKPIAYCGHATIASMNILRQQELIEEGKYILQTNENPIPVAIEKNKVYMQQAYPEFYEVNMDEVAALSNTTKENITTAILTYNGVGYLLIEIKDSDTLYYLQPDIQLVYDYSAKHNLIGLYLYTKAGEIILSRMLGPYYGIAEENATGMAAGLLGGWLHYESAGQTKELNIEQGHSYVMKEKGFLHVLINEEEATKKILVGGEAVIKETATLTAVTNS